MTAKSRQRKFAQKKVHQPHQVITKIEEGHILRFQRDICTCPENKHHFAKENN